MKIYIDLRSVKDIHKPTNGGEAYVVEQYNILKSKYNLYAIVKNNLKGIDCEQVIINDNFQSFLNVSGGLLISGMPYDLYKYDLSNFYVLITIHGLRYLEEPWDFKKVFYSNDKSKFIHNIASTLLPTIYRDFRERQYLDVLKLKCRSLSVIVPSYYSRRSLEYFAVRHKISIEEIHVESSHLPSDLMKLRNIKNEKENYILFLNGDRSVKNLIRAYKAVNIYNKTSKKKFLLYVTGNVSSIIRMSYSKDVRYLGYVKSERLNEFLNGMSLLLYTTLNEGYGYPPALALFRKKPVVASSLSVLFEIYGNQLIYANPMSVYDIAAAIHEALNSFAKSTKVDKPKIKGSILLNIIDKIKSDKSV